MLTFRSSPLPQQPQARFRNALANENCHDVLSQQQPAPLQSSATLLQHPKPSPFETKYAPLVIKFKGDQL